MLGRFIPDFGKIVAMMQFNMYHHYTVDEHLIRAVGILSEIEHGAFAGDHPLSTNIFPTLAEPARALCRGPAARHRQGPRRRIIRSPASASRKALGPRLGL